MSIKSAVCIMWVNGKEMSPDLVRRIVSLTLTYPKNKAKSGVIVFRDENFELFDTRIFRKDQVLHFKCGWVDEVLPAGPYVIKSYSTSAPSTGIPTLTVKFQDLTHKMNKKQKQKRHVGNPTEIIKRIAESHGLGYDIFSIAGLEYSDESPLIQAAKSDAATVHNLATRYGYIWGVDGATLFFKKPGDRQNYRKLKPPVLSYRINDWSLMSFQPEIKYSSGRKRKKAKEDLQNFDLGFGGKDGEDMLESMLPDEIGGKNTKELLAENPHDSKAGLVIEQAVVGLVGGEDSAGGSFIHEAVDSTERLISWLAGTGYQTNAEVMGGDVRVAAKIALPKAKQNLPEAETEKENEQLEQGDESGAATPDNRAEAARRALAKAERAKQIITGSVVPRVASMRFVPHRQVTLLGLGKFLSGEYMITEVTQKFGEGASGFSTEFKVTRSKFLPGQRALEAIQTSVYNMSESDPIKREIEELLSDYTEGGKLKVTLIDGKEDV